MEKSKLKILVIDNNEVFLNYTEHLFNQEGYIVRTAENGLVAIDLMKDFIPDMVFTDLIMPNISGLEISRFIRHTDELKHIFIVIVSAVAVESNEYETPDVADAYLAKRPFGEMGENLLEVVEQFKQNTAERKYDTIIGTEGLVSRTIIQELLFAKKHHEAMLNTMSEGVIEISGPGHRIVYVNPVAALITGLDPAMDLSRKVSEIFCGSEKDEFELQLQAASQTSGHSIHRTYTINGYIADVVVLEIVLATYASKVILLRDVTKFKENEENLEKTIQDKEMLLREINHRVKNNLSMVSSIIEMERQKVDGTSQRHVLDDLLQRINSLFLLYDHLHTAHDLKRVSVEDYIPELVTMIIDNLYTAEKPVDCSLDIEPALIGADIVIPLGLITTELVTNAIKYGFTEETEHPHISVVFRAQPELLLEIFNTGVPFPEEIDPGESEGLGLVIVYGLAKQLGCTVELRRENGTRFIIREGPQP